MKHVNSIGSPTGLSANKVILIILSRLFNTFKAPNPACDSPLKRLEP